MFTGIVECTGKVEQVSREKSNIVFVISSPVSRELKIDQSVAHNGVCLTVVKCNEKTHTVVAIQETLDKTSLGDWKTGTLVNIERCMPANGRFDGHIVQGHVDTVAEVEKTEDLNGSWKFWFRHPTNKNFVTVEKGSITVNGTSLTVVDSMPGQFSVCIIPYTFENTVFSNLKKGDRVNIEFDVVGKYVARLLELKNL